MGISFKLKLLNLIYVVAYHLSIQMNAWRTCSYKVDIRRGSKRKTSSKGGESFDEESIGVLAN